MRLPRSVILSLLTIGWLACLLAWSGGPGAHAQTPAPDMPPLPQGLEPPPTVYPPTEIYKGSYIYYQVCMACHGDRGQGLTEDWRAMLDPPDQNCWQSKCHASNYPPGGFVFPKYVPAVAGPIILARFETGLDLHEYIRAEMPFQAPGSLSEEEYWQLTAFLLSLNGADPGDEPLNAEQAARIYLDGARQPAPPPVAVPTQLSPHSDPEQVAYQPAGESAGRAGSTRRIGRYAAIGLLVAAGFAILLILKPTRRSDP